MSARMNSTNNKRTTLAPISKGSGAASTTNNSIFFLESLGSVNDHKKDYKGDVWGTRGVYNEGMIYLSRMSAPGEHRSVKKSENDTSNVSDIINNNLNLHDMANENDRLKAKKRCAIALCSISWNQGFESQIVREGGLKALINLSNLKDTVAQTVSEPFYV